MEMQRDSVGYDILMGKIQDGDLNKNQGMDSWSKYT